MVGWERRYSTCFLSSPQRDESWILPRKRLSSTICAVEASPLSHPSTAGVYPRGSLAARLRATFRSRRVDSLAYAAGFHAHLLATLFQYHFEDKRGT
jgi:hypothetical protein